MGSQSMFARLVWLFLLHSCHCGMLAQPADAKAADAKAGDRSVDLVVAWYCEDLWWLTEVSQEFADFLTVYIYDKSDQPCRHVVPSLPFRVITEHLPNVGQDGHTQVTHISRYWEDLAEYTIFVQGGSHWTMRPPSEDERKFFGYSDIVFHGWQTQAKIINELLPQALRGDTAVIPLLRRRHDKGPVLWGDVEYEEQSMFDAEANVIRFEMSQSDMFNSARELFATLFGGSPCSVHPLLFMPGMQYIARRDVLQAKPVAAWKALLTAFEWCGHFGWYYERMVRYILDPKLHMVEMDPRKWREPTFCSQPGLAAFPVPSKPVNPAHARFRRDFWKHKWGCDPWSEEMRQRMASQDQGEAPETAEL